MLAEQRALDRIIKVLRKIDRTRRFFSKSQAELLFVRIRHVILVAWCNTGAEPVG
jgi:hypothetical protein